jgi:MFS family permease
VGTWNLGCFVSAILTIFVGDYLGRKKTLMLGLTFWVIGEIVQASSYSFGQFVAGRAIAGFGNILPPFFIVCVIADALQQATASRLPSSPPTKPNA